MSLLVAAAVTINACVVVALTLSAVRCGVFLQVTAAVTMPEPGYVATPIITVDAALVLLEERQQLLARAGGGGVFTAGALFRDSSLVERLSRDGVVFQVLQKSW